jgi:hypothetical protein
MAIGFGVTKGDELVKNGTLTLHELDLIRQRADLELLEHQDDAAGESTDLTIRIHEASSIARQSADLDMIPYRIGCRKSMARRQCGQLDPPAGEESVRGDEQGIRPPGDKRRECCINLQAGARIEDLDLQFGRPLCG